VQPAEDRLDLLLPQVRRQWLLSAPARTPRKTASSCPAPSLRKALSEGAEIVPHFGRDEVLVILKEYYQGLTEKVEVKMQGAASGAQDVILQP